MVAVCLCRGLMRAMKGKERLELVNLIILLCINFGLVAGNNSVDKRVVQGVSHKSTQVCPINQERSLGTPGT